MEALPKVRSFTVDAKAAESTQGSMGKQRSKTSGSQLPLHHFPMHSTHAPLLFRGWWHIPSKWPPIGNIIPKLTEQKDPEGWLHLWINSDSNQMTHVDWKPWFSQDPWLTSRRIQEAEQWVCLHWNSLLWDVIITLICKPKCRCLCEH